MWNVFVSSLLTLPNLPGWVINGPILFCSLESRRLPEGEVPREMMGKKPADLNMPTSPTAAPWPVVRGPIQMAICLKNKSPMSQLMGMDGPAPAKRIERFNQYFSSVTKQCVTQTHHRSLNTALETGCLGDGHLKASLAALFAEGRFGHPSPSPTYPSPTPPPPTSLTSHSPSPTPPTSQPPPTPSPAFTPPHPTLSHTPPHLRPLPHPHLHLHLNSAQLTSDSGGFLGGFCANSIPISRSNVSSFQKCLLHILSITHQLEKKSSVGTVVCGSHCQAWSHTCICCPAIHNLPYFWFTGKGEKTDCNQEARSPTPGTGAVGCVRHRRDLPCGGCPDPSGQYLVQEGAAFHSFQDRRVMGQGPNVEVDPPQLVDASTHSGHAKSQALSF